MSNESAESEGGKQAANTGMVAVKLEGKMLGIYMQTLLIVIILWVEQLLNFQETEPYRTII